MGSLFSSPKPPTPDPRILESQKKQEALLEKQERRAEQRVRWLWDSVEDLVQMRMRSLQSGSDLEAQVREGTLPPTLAARRLLDD